MSQFQKRWEWDTKLPTLPFWQPASNAKQSPSTDPQVQQTGGSCCLSKHSPLDTLMAEFFRASLPSGSEDTRKHSPSTPQHRAYTSPGGSALHHAPNEHPPCSPGVQEEIPSHRAGCGAPRSQTHALTTGSILDLFLHPRLSRSRAPVLVVRQPVDKSATEAVSSLRPRCNPALQDDSFYSYVLKPIFNPFNICHGDFFSFQFLTNVCCIESNTYRSHMCITSTSSSSSAPSVNLLKRQTFTRSIFHK